MGAGTGGGVGKEEAEALQRVGVYFAAMSKEPAKRRFSLDFRNAVEPLLKGNRSLFRYEEELDSDLMLRDIKEGSRYYFRVNTEKWDPNQGAMVEYGCWPWSKSHLSPNRTTERLHEFAAKLKEWFHLIQLYNAESVLDDPIVTNYQERYFADWKIVDSDADDAPFAYEHQLLLESYLDEVEGELDEERSEANAGTIDYLKEAITEVRGSLTTETKNGVMGRLSKLWAKAQKSGLKYSKSMLKRFGDKVFDKVAELAFKYATEHAHNLPGYVERIEKAISNL